MKVLLLLLAHTCFAKTYVIKKEAVPGRLNANEKIDNLLEWDSSGDDVQETKERILTQTIVDEELSNDAKGVHIKEAIKAFDEKMKYMDSTEITNAETFIEKKEEALAEQKAEEKYKSKIVEGDIIKTDVVEAIMNNDTSKHNLHVGEKWGLIVAYELPKIIHGDGRMQRALNEGMKELSAKSCIKFIKRKNDGTSRFNKDLDGKNLEPYLRFTQGDGCYSHIGKRGIGQEISIGTGCEYKGTVMHEILHALGFWHEQSRLDRDKYVKIKFENILEDAKSNFMKYNAGEADTLEYPYDLDSIMHYGPDYFSKNGKNTIDVIREGKIVGQRDDLSPTDIDQLNSLYCSKADKEKYDALRKSNFETMRQNVYASY